MPAHTFSVMSQRACGCLFLPPWKHRNLFFISFISLEAHFLPSALHCHLRPTPPHPPQQYTLFRRSRLQCLSGRGKHDAGTWSCRIFDDASPQKPSPAEKTQAAAGARRLFSHFATQHMSSHASTLPLPSPPGASRVHPPLPQVRPPQLRLSVLAGGKRLPSAALPTNSGKPLLGRRPVAGVPACAVRERRGMHLLFRVHMSAFIASRRWEELGHCSRLQQPVSTPHQGHHTFTDELISPSARSRR